MKICAVFNTSAKSSSNVALNDILLVGPTVHSLLLDVLLRFRLHQIALTADVSKMYRVIELVEYDWDLHRFVWRSDPDEPIQYYQMTGVIKIFDIQLLWCIRRCMHMLVFCTFADKISIW